MERFGVRFGVYKNGIFNEQLLPFDAIPRVMFGRDLSPEKLAELKQLIIDEPRRWIAGLTVVSLPVIKMGLWQNRRPIPSYAICREQTW
ncbi:hypothetical protein [uncultured Bacteroides sp.]|uniref:hypothetical protein n=1 Tax=uncultured Bacteroides sp. TaxID=162156 RepID=UPI00260C0E92|nr:hypothetical protein [uncultured Bacteroides sp.]